MSTSQKIYICVNRDGTPIMFSTEEMPTRANNTWIGQYYVNADLYTQVCNLVANSMLTYENDPEIIEFQTTMLSEVPPPEE